MTASISPWDKIDQAKTGLGIEVFRVKVGPRNEKILLRTRKAASQSHSSRLRNLNTLLKCFRRVSRELFSRRVMVSGGGHALLGAGDIFI
jgi:hypothetical protein